MKFTNGMKFAATTILSLSLVYLFCFITYKSFNASPVKSHYFKTKGALVKLAESTATQIPKLIQNDGLTWDPTFGAETDRVLNNLKKTNYRKILMISSSQFFFIHGDSTSENLAPKQFDARVDQALKKNMPGFEVYNISIGGMGIKEIEAVMTAAMNKLDFEIVLVGLNPSILLNYSLRNAVKSLSNTGQTQIAPPPVAAEITAPSSTFSKPNQIMAKVTLATSAFLKNYIPLLEYRAEIRSWLYDIVTGHEPSTLAAVPPPESPTAQFAQTEPIQFIFTTEEQEAILTRLEAFYNVMGDLQARTGETKFMVLINPVRQDTKWPAYSPPEFLDRWFLNLKRYSEKHGIQLINAYSLLDASHYGPYSAGSKIHPLHYDSTGHVQLAEFLAKSLR